MEAAPKTPTTPKTPPPDMFPDKTMDSCQWFLNADKFCDKIKKNVRCDGNVKNCPF